MLFAAFIFALCVLDAVSTASLPEGADPMDGNLTTWKRLVRESSKSKEMCKKYAESVYITVKDREGGEDFHLDSCTIVEPFITDGVDAQPREYPHMALIGYGEKSSIRWLCGGSLVSERFVLGAAHCSKPNKDAANWVKLGEYNQNSKEDEDMGISQAVEYEIIERIVHPEYKSPGAYNDIALYKLGTKVDFNEFIRPACLQTEHEFHQTYAIATGWGGTAYRGSLSDVLQKVNLTIIPRKQCSESYKPTSGKLDNGIVDEQMICAGDNGKDTCQGDAGGPLQIRLKEPYCMYSVIGITSFGEKCALKPSVFTRVSHYVPWIESIVWP